MQAINTSHLNLTGKYQKSGKSETKITHAQIVSCNMRPLYNFVKQSQMTITDLCLGAQISGCDWHKMPLCECIINRRLTFCLEILSECFSLWDSLF